ncbi:MAG: PQQ-binding-like beta-propeller repeat protein [Anaerolineaceae bacterium]|nr:PQQ-binding-like beta-propeller repeat protein [Anaerolineaceae bacterium]
MIKKHRMTILSILILAGLLTGCTGAAIGTSWPGVGASGDAAYLSNGNLVYAVQLNNGTMLWSYPQEKSRIMYYAPPVFSHDGQVIVGDYSNTLYSINPKSGTTNWKFTQASGRYVGGVLVTDDAIYAPNADFSVYALDLAGGLKWKHTTGQAVWARPAVDGDVVYVNSLDHFTYALDADDGALIWKTDLQGPTVSSPVPGNGKIFTGMLDNGLVAMDAASGDILWETVTDDGVYGTPVFKDGKLYLADLSGNIYCIDADNGGIDWRIQSGGQIAASLAVIDNGIIFTNGTGLVTAVDFTGTIIWSRTITGELNSDPVVSGDIILIPSFQGDNLLTAFNFSGDQKWSFNP